MSKTLFWYLFKDLFRIFMMASGALAGIMSFGGLLRPLTEHGLDAGQVGKMLTYLTPAMMTYSLPVAALFATTMVYGRLSADNELTACRAGGLSYLVIGLPAVVLGLLVAILSLLLLCFIVPQFSLKVEQVIYSNIAKVMANKIERNHEIRFGQGTGMATVFAQSAELLPPSPDRPGQEVVILDDPAIATYETPDKTDPRLRVPKEIWMAKRATVMIRPGGTSPADGDASLSVHLDGGTKFPRKFAGNVQAGVESTDFGPLRLPNPIRENVKFMDVGRLTQLAADPGLSQRVSIVVQEFIRRDQQQQYLKGLFASLRDTGKCELRSGAPDGETYVLDLGDGRGFLRDDQLILQVPPPATAPAGAKPPPPTSGPHVSMQRIRNDQVNLTADAREIRVSAVPDVGHVRRDGRDEVHEQMAVNIELYSAVVRTGSQANDRASFAQGVTVPMPPEVLKYKDKTLAEYAADPNLSPIDANRLLREQVCVSNAVRDELHSRASFAVSCMILVIVGCALGMMFKSGNFLSAFAVSFLPALLCITLIVAGQQTADHVPAQVLPHFNNPLGMGLCLIWSGNVIVLLLAVVLGLKLQRR